MNLHDATGLEARFSTAKFTIIELTKWRVKVCTILVWYYIEGADQENDPVLCTKDEWLDWTEITKSGTRQNPIC